MFPKAGVTPVGPGGKEAILIKDCIHVLGNLRILGNSDLSEKSKKTFIKLSLQGVLTDPMCL